MIGRVIVVAGIGLITLLMWLAVAAMRQPVAPPPASEPEYANLLAWVGVDLFVDENTGAYVVTNNCPGAKMDGGRSADVVWINANNPANHVVFADGETCRVIRVCTDTRCVADG